MIRVLCSGCFLSVFGRSRRIRLVLYSLPKLCTATDGERDLAVVEWVLEGRDVAVQVFGRWSDYGVILLYKGLRPARRPRKLHNIYIYIYM